MSPLPSFRTLSTALLLATCVAHPAPAAGQDATPAQNTRPQPAPQSGFDVVANVATNRLTARDSFAAAGLDPRPVEFGGGVQANNVWRSLFVQLSVSRWSDSGERAFIDEGGARFPLGIPLDVSATYLDVGTGWEIGLGGRRASPRVLPYAGAGLGAVFYREKSPFAEPGDDVDERKASYHVLAGVQVRLLDWLGVAFDARYRWVPDLLGEGGISAALGDEAFGGLQAGVGVRVGFRRAGRVAETPRGPERSPGQLPPGTAPAGRPATRAGETALIDAAPVYLRPDNSRTPLRVLERGARVQVLEVRGEWLLVEFHDPQFGPRRGYVERRHVQVPKQN